MAGLVPAIHVLKDSRVEIVPSRIVNDNLANFPGARPMLDRFLTLDRVANVVEHLEKYKPIEAVSFEESSDCTGSMFIYATHQIGRYANV